MEYSFSSQARKNIVLSAKIKQIRLSPKVKNAFRLNEARLNNLIKEIDEEYNINKTYSSGIKKLKHNLMILENTKPLAKEKIKKLRDVLQKLRAKHEKKLAKARKAFEDRKKEIELRNQKRIELVKKLKSISLILDGKGLRVLTTQDK